MDSESECQESVAITFEWTVRGLQKLFDSTKGESKSKVTKSLGFGGGRWQILFYANAGIIKEGSTEGSGYVSLYLSCEPTTEEKEAAMGDSGRWVRDGVYKFSFELRNIGKSVLYNLKEAKDHTFSHKTANWGWAQFAKRDTVYYQSNAVKTQDAFVIICSITSSPSPPVPPPVFPRQTVPKDLLDTVGALLDDPLYSDVEFIIPRRGQRLRSARSIWASRRLLKRAEYFETMFNSGFAEGSTKGTPTPRTRMESVPSIIESESQFVMNEFEDSDHEEEDDAMDDSPVDIESASPHQSGAVDSLVMSPAENIIDEGEREGEDQRNVRAKLSHPSSPRSSEPVNLSPRLPELASGSKMTVVVKDVAYSTYLALLYYIYTDTIVFAPLSSSFISARGDSPTSSMSTLPSMPAEAQEHAMQEFTATTRKEWIKEWLRNNPGRPAPCSPKAAYRLADRMDLRELKERASQHILKSLTVDNIAYEVFSPFAAKFDEIQQVQVNFFLTHWQDIRASDSMRNVWQQIRSGRHPGFEEVWPVIAQSLEFKPARSVIGSSAAAGEDTTR
ncbi:hypothetical protein L208DRAFT_1422001 [Tricholoma matsutake]|nr:hypothetical protein L208DRAFT_1422001 [Tricholoma matsutake 945]